MPYQLNLSAEKNKFAALTSNMKLIGKSFDLDGITMAIKRAVLDITARTLRPVPGHDSRDTLERYLLGETRNDGNPSFLDRVVAYFGDVARDTEKKFDSWHHETCMAVLADINKYYKNPSGSDVCYGKAQKIVNMTMKGCYCLQGADAKEEYFKYCHVPLDSFTLEWFYREVVTNWWNATNQNGNRNKINKTQIDSWSNVEYLDLDIGDTTASRFEQYIADNSTRRINNRFYHYVFIQDIIRSFLRAPAPGTSEQNKYRAYTPFQAEFFVWPEIQLHLAAEALFGQSIGQEEILDKFNEIFEQRNDKKIQELKDEQNKAETDFSKRRETSDARIQFQRNRKNPTAPSVMNNIAREESSFAKYQSKHEKKMNELNEKIEKLRKVEDMDAAIRKYKDMSLADKMSLLREKINLLMDYCNCSEENQA